MARRTPWGQGCLTAWPWLYSSVLVASAQCDRLEGPTKIGQRKATPRAPERAHSGSDLGRQ